jgi:hypothetical protein
MTIDWRPPRKCPRCGRPFAGNTRTCLKCSTGAARQSECDDFNAMHPVGSQIRVWPGAVNAAPPVTVTIVEPRAYVLGGHTAVVQVTGGHGCITLTHVMREAP